MIKYFRSLFSLMRFRLENLGLPKDHNYYPVVKVVQQVMKKQLFQPFKSTHNINIKKEYALGFQKKLLAPYSSEGLNYDLILTEELDFLLLDFNLVTERIYFDNDTISSFSYTYLCIGK